MTASISALGWAVLATLSGCLGGGRKDGSPPNKDAPGCPDSDGWSYAAAGWFMSCGVHRDGCAECWGLEGLQIAEDTGVYGQYYPTGEDLPPSIPFLTLALVTGAEYGGAGNQACGVKTDGGVACWGRNDKGQSNAPSGSFLSVEVFDSGSCGLRSDGVIECWGQGYAPPDGSFRELSIGEFLGVALNAGGDATAWYAASVFGKELPETRIGPFEAVSAGSSWACAVRLDGSLFCWSPGYPELDKDFGFTPAGTYTAVCVGYQSACALQPDGHPVCFGMYPDLPEYDVPDVSLTQISCGVGFVCGVTTDHDTVCWGNNDYGQATPPD